MSPFAARSSPDGTDDVTQSLEDAPPSTDCAVSVDSFGERGDRSHPNTVDVLRFVGALCIIWHHSGYFWSLEPSVQNAIQQVKLATIAWSLPFFYTTSSWFALMSTSRDVTFGTVSRKLSNYLVLLLGWSAIYGTWKYVTHLDDGLSGIVGANGGGLAMGIALLQQIRGVFNTPAYYIADLAVIYVFAVGYGLAVRAWPRLRGRVVVAAVMLALMALLAVDCGPASAWSRYLFMNRSAAIGMCVGFACALLGLRPRMARTPISSGAGVALVLGALGFFGAMNIVWFDAQYWGAGAMRFSGLLFVMFPVLSAFVVFRVGSGALRAISVAGSRYALGLLVAHPAALYFMDWFVPGVIKRLFAGFGAGVPAFVLINVGATLLALCMVAALRRYAPALVTVWGARTADIRAAAS